MKVKLTLAHVFEIDIDDLNEDEMKSSMKGLEFDETDPKKLDKHGLHDVLRDMLENDLDNVVDIADVEAADFTIEVLPE